MFCFKIQSRSIEDRWIWIPNARKSSKSRFIRVLRTEYNLDTVTVEKFLYFWAVLADVGSLVWDANPFVLSASEPRVQECRSVMVSEVGGKAPDPGPGQDPS